MCRQLTFDLDSERDGRRSLQARVEELRALEVGVFH